MFEITFIVNESVVKNICDSDMFNYMEIFIIGDQFPLSWDTKKFKLMYAEDHFEITVGFSQRKKLKYRYLLRFINRKGEEIHYLDIPVLGKTRETNIENKTVCDHIDNVGKVPSVDASTRSVCRFPFQNPVIAYNGDVTVCCADNEFSLCIGNVTVQPLSELWGSEKIQNYRLWQIRGDLHSMPYCKSCVSFRENPLTDEEVYNYLKYHEMINEYYFYKRRMRGTQILKYLIIDFSNNSNEEIMYKICRDLQENNIYLDLLVLLFSDEITDEACSKIIMKIDDLNRKKPFYSSLDGKNTEKDLQRSIAETFKAIKTNKSVSDDILSISHKKPCFCIFEVLMVKNNGDVTVCCYNAQNSISVGNIKDNSFSDILNGEELQQIHIDHILEKDLQFCENCPVSCDENMCSISDHTVINYLKNIKRYDVIEKYIYKIINNEKIDNE